MRSHSIHPENTHVRKHQLSDKLTYDILQGSVEVDSQPREPQEFNSALVRVVGDDHSDELKRICDCLQEAQKYAANQLQESIISMYQQSFRSGDIEAYKESQRMWVKDQQPSVEAIFGFVEPYRDPFGMRSEFEGLVAVVDKNETKTLTKLVENSAKFIRRLPWAENSAENDGKGPFEKTLFQSPDFTSLHSKIPAQLFRLY